MIESRREQNDLLRKKGTGLIEKGLIIAVALIVFAFAAEMASSYLTRPSEEYLLGTEMEYKYAPRLKPYADFTFNEESKSFKLEITDQDTIDELYYFIEDGVSISDEFGWNVIVENMLVLSTEIQQETGESYDFLVMNPEKENEVFLLIEDSEVSYNRFPLLEE